MMICKKCKGTDIKSHRNYSHGKKSKPTTILVCKKCGSTDLEAESNYKRRQKRR
ncbi:MAG: hypothetical protein U9R08_01595 [Nanoarchaeota archaeon]|nr:hypothetical protein [Nanoarchaeota archaeon]